VSRPGGADDLPDIRERSELVRRAWCFAHAAHEGDRSRGNKRIDHPVAVAQLLAREGASDELIAAALLHDVLEDTSVGRAELEEMFGSDVAALVAAVSEDPSIDDYGERKAQLRAQVDAAGEDAALIFLADKLAQLQELEAPPATMAPRRLDHYRKTLALLRSSYPGVPFIGELARRLA
jgi:guanosine-3',5'-bis(diphosphate) 3'-pyrophosphohydrolase